ncbi:FAD-binding protein [Companilactobacillus keshanensis]|uniref:Urocanate reductase n=1 Tax=Companilactobacillus keshanensis TaxID=2486003 RepID=A0ABW4BUD8_9LACO|nr:FAD-binding protein [Companilactobacillus keshanensis]
MFKNRYTSWDATYDVAVLGFGGAGATAARFAADNGAKVLLVDSAPEGHEGGNTRYAGQVIASGDNLEDLKKYYDALADPLSYDKNLMNRYVEGLYKIPEYLEKYLGVKPFVMGKHPDSPVSKALYFMAHEYPELSGEATHELVAVHEGVADAALWKNLRKQVTDREDRIDVLYETPAKHLIQDFNSKAIIGIQIEQNDQLLDIKVNNGVVLATGGFENNSEMVETYLGETSLHPIGSLYNQGAGVSMAQDIGAKLYNMANYESYGIFHGLTPKPAAGQRAQFLPFDWPALHSGSVFVVGDDGTRYFDENEIHRHGHIQNHGQWRIPNAQLHPYVIFDDKKFNELNNDDNAPYPEFLKAVIKADNLDQLADKIEIDNGNLRKTVGDFNKFAEEKRDFAFDRAPETLEKFDNGPYYALAFAQGLLNTVGGPVHNEDAEVIDTNNNVIPNLYAAGELGSLMGRKYNGGSNLAEDLIFGKIAGENAAKEKSITIDATTSASKHVDLKFNNKESFETGPNQYIGRSNAGMGNEIVVRVTMEDSDIKNVEILKQSESEDYGAKAVRMLPQEIIEANSTDVDAVSGASVSSAAIKEAVQDALKKIAV